MRSRHSISNRSGVPTRVLFAVGGVETTAFRQQTADMHAAWLHASNRSRHLVMDGADHLSLLRHPQRPEPLLQSILDLIQRA